MAGIFYFLHNHHLVHLKETQEEETSSDSTGPSPETLNITNKAGFAGSSEESEYAQLMNDDVVITGEGEGNGCLPVRYCYA